MSKRSRPTLEQNPAERLQAMIAAEQVKRAQACLAEVKAVLERHNCDMQAEMFLANGRADGRVNIFALPNRPTKDSPAP